MVFFQSIVVVRMVTQDLESESSNFVGPRGVPPMVKHVLATLDYIDAMHKFHRSLLSCPGTPSVARRRVRVATFQARQKMLDSPGDSENTVLKIGFR
jgi:hypothetical protein